jgi:hypothetical protein
MKNNASLLYNAFLIVGDFLALVAAFVAAYILRVKIDLRPLLEPISAATYLSIFLTVLPFWILIFAWLGLYNTSIYEKRFKEFSRLLVGSFIGLLLVVFWDFVAKEPIFPARLVPIYGFALGFLFLLIFRNLARFVRVQLFSYNIGLTKVLLVGNAHMTGELVDWLADGRRSGYQIVGVVGQKRTVGNRDVPTYPSLNSFWNTTKMPTCMASFKPNYTRMTPKTASCFRLHSNSIWATGLCLAIPACWLVTSKSNCFVLQCRLLQCITRHFLAGDELSSG